MLSAQPDKQFIKIDNETCNNIREFKVAKKRSMENHTKIQEVHDRIMDKQEEFYRRKMEEANGGPLQINPNEEFKINQDDYKNLRSLYNDGLKQVSEEQNILIAVLGQLETIITGMRPDLSEQPLADGNRMMVDNQIPPQIPTKRPPQQKEFDSISAAASLTTQKNLPPSLPPQKLVGTPMELDSVDAQQNQSIPQKRPPINAQNLQQHGKGKTKPTAAPKSTIQEPIRFQHGQEVVAKVKPQPEPEDQEGEEAEEPEENWFLCVFDRYLDKNRAIVQDADEEEEKVSYEVQISKVFALPHDFKDAPKFNKGDQVLAMFPETTTFYGATVDIPAKPASKFYLVKFENDEDKVTKKTPPRRVRFDRLLPLPKDM